MRENTKMVYITATEFIISSTATSISDNGPITLNRVTAHLNGIMDMYTRVDSKMTKDMATECISTKMEKDTWVNGLMTKEMEKVNIY